MFFHHPPVSPTLFPSSPFLVPLPPAFVLNDENHILIPSAVVGHLIGRKATSIQKMEDDSGVKIQILEKVFPQSTFQVVLFNAQGDKEKLEYAKSLVVAHIQQRIPGWVPPERFPMHTLAPTISDYNMNFPGPFGIPVEMQKAEKRKENRADSSPEPLNKVSRMEAPVVQPPPPPMLTSTPAMLGIPPPAPDQGPILLSHTQPELGSKPPKPIKLNSHLQAKLNALSNKLRKGKSAKKQSLNSSPVEPSQPVPSDGSSCASPAAMTTIDYTKIGFPATSTQSERENFIDYLRNNLAWSAYYRSQDMYQNADHVDQSLRNYAISCGVKLHEGGESIQPPPSDVEPEKDGQGRSYTIV